MNVENENEESLLWPSTRQVRRQREGLSDILQRDQSPICRTPVSCCIRPQKTRDLQVLYR